MSLVLPQSTVKLIETEAVPQRHPGLQLDKFSISGDQQAQKAALNEVCKTQGDDSLLRALSERRRRTLQLLPGSVTFSRTTTGPLTLHLARASALENAGICLHPIYGFAYLPGSGLKGMARAYAETVWLPAQDDPKQGWRQIEDIFGWASNPERKQQINDPHHPAERRRVDDADPDSPEIKAHVGDIVFHDAWPETWPQLIVDIVNNHHPDYYQHDDNDHAPGDWENPVPVYFLAVKPKTTFSFPLAKRRLEVGDELLDLARQWLLGALCHLGAGAKTNAGYGAFEPADAPMPELPGQSRAVFETTLELVTPAFLAGANQQAEDCDLRSATLRGHLRWWWRTMHAGFLDVKTLRALEAAIWGDTNSGGAVRIALRRVDKNQPIPTPGKHVAKNKRNQDVLRLDPQFAKANRLVRAPQKTTQGLLYLCFGMDEMPAGKLQERKQRWCLLPGAQWEIVISARDGLLRSPVSTADGKPSGIPARMICEQAKAALCLLCQYGGVGSKGRNGFGSLSMDQPVALDNIRQIAATLRNALPVPQNDAVGSVSSLAEMISTELIKTPWKNYWFVMDQLGFSIQTFCQADGRKRNWVKEALGLPRKIGCSDNDGSKDRGYLRTFDKQTKQEVVWLGQKHPYLGNRDAKDMRHASPVHCHIARNSHGTYSIQAVAFPCIVLPDASTSKSILQSLLSHLESDLADRADSYSDAGSTPSSSAKNSEVGSTTSRTSIAATGKRRFGTPARVRIIAERPNGGYDVQEQGYPQGTLTVGTPPEAQPNIGDDVDVAVHNDDPKRPQYRWINPNQKVKDKPKGDRGGKRGRGRR